MEYRTCLRYPVKSTTYLLSRFKGLISYGTVAHWNMDNLHKDLVGWAWLRILSWISHPLDSEQSLYLSCTSQTASISHLHRYMSLQTWQTLTVCSSSLWTWSPTIWLGFPWKSRCYNTIHNRLLLIKETQQSLRYINVLYMGLNDKSSAALIITKSMNEN